MPINLAKRHSKKQHILKRASILLTTSEGKKTKQSQIKSCIISIIKLTVPKINKHIPRNRLIRTR